MFRPFYACDDILTYITLWINLTTVCGGAAVLFLEEIDIHAFIVGFV
jgi:hypothetical protein